MFEIEGNTIGSVPDVLCERCGNKTRRDGPYFPRDENKPPVQIFECKTCGRKTRDPARRKDRQLKCQQLLEDYLVSGQSLHALAQKTGLARSTVYYELRQAARKAPDCVALWKELKDKLRWHGILGSDTSYYGHQRSRSQKVYVHFVDVLSGDSPMYKLLDWNGTKQQYSSVLFQTISELRFKLDYKLLAVIIDRDDSEIEAIKRTYGDKVLMIGCLQHLRLELEKKLPTKRLTREIARTKDKIAPMLQGQTLLFSDGKCEVIKTASEMRRDRYSETKRLILEIAAAENWETRKSLIILLKQLDDKRKNDRVHRVVTEFLKPDWLGLYPTRDNLESLLGQALAEEISKMTKQGSSKLEIERYVQNWITRIRYNNSSENRHGQIRKLANHHSSFPSRCAQGDFINAYWAFKRRRLAQLGTLDNYLNEQS